MRFQKVSTDLYGQFTTVIEIVWPASEIGWAESDTPKLPVNVPVNGELPVNRPV